MAISGFTSCGDEPQHHRPGTHSSDTIQPPDSTHHPTDTTSRDTTSRDTTRFTISIAAPRPYGYMGQTMQLTATTSSRAPIVWSSSRTDLATVDQSGMVTFANSRTDGQAIISATANGVTATLPLECRCWQVAMQDGTAWTVPEAPTVHPGDTLVLTIVDSGLRTIDDGALNAACRWSYSSRNANISTLVAQVLPSGTSPLWLTRYVIGPSPANGAILIVKASLGDAASSMQVVISNP